MEKINLRLEYEHQWIYHPFTVITKIDNRVINVDVSGKSNVVIDKKISLEGGSHYLDIVLSGKQENQTEIDKLGKIIADTTVELKSLQLEEIELIPLIRHTPDFGTFYINGQKDQIMKKLANFGFNGTWQFEFKTPLYDWILQHIMI